MIDLLLKDEVYKLVGAAMAVYNELGPGFLEAVYQEAYEIELADAQIPFLAQHELLIQYKGRLLCKTYRADVVGYEQIIVELKAISQLTEHDEAQLLNSLKATSFEVGLLLNFGARDRLEWKRMVRTHDHPRNRSGRHAPRQ